VFNSASSGNLLNQAGAARLSVSHSPSHPLTDRPDGIHEASPQELLANALVPLVVPAGGSNAHQLATLAAAEILLCVRGNEFDSTRLIGSPFEPCLAALPAAGWAALQQHALTQSPSGITSVTLSPLLAVPLDGQESGLVEGLNQLPALAHLSLVNPFAGWINLRGLCLEGREPPAIDIRCDSADTGPWKLHVPKGTRVEANGPAAACPGSKVVYFDGAIPLEELTLGGAIIPGGSLPSQADAQNALALNELTLALAPAADKLGKGPEHAALAAKAILACVDVEEGGVLDFTRLTGRESNVLMADLPAAGWVALQNLVLAQTGEGITSVALSRDLCVALQFKPGNTLIEGINHLQGLGQLTLHEPPGSELKLSGLRIEAGLPAIEIHSGHEDPGPWTVFAPKGADVSANARSVATRPSTVVYLDGLRPVKKGVLHGLIYDRKPTDFGMDAKAARDVMLNGKVAGIVCGQLAAKWLTARSRHRDQAHAQVAGAQRGAQAAASGHARYSYKNSMTKEAIAASTSPVESANFLQLWQQGPDALFEASRFGDLLAQEFEGLAEGQTRQLVVGSLGHAMAAELRVKDGEYVVNFHDPNHTAMHRRVVVGDPARLRGRSLQDWIGREGIDLYFGKGGKTSIGGIYRWPGGNRQPLTMDALQRHVPLQHRMSPQYLLYLQSARRTGEATAFVQEMNGFLDKLLADHASGQIDSAQMKAQVLGRWGDLTGWWQAANEVMVPVLEKYLNWVLTSPLSSAQKWELLRSDGGGAGGLSAHIVLGWHEMIDTYVQAIGSAPEAALSRQHQRALLDVRDPADAAGGVPLLHHLAYEGLEDKPEGVVHALSTFVQSVVRAQLEIEVTAELCGAAYDVGDDAQSAVQLALAAGNLPVASAIAFAVQANEPDAQRKADLLARLKVDMPELRTALRQWVAQREAAKSAA
jgi:hypothetical protein